ncbi:MAG TPA: hypothetical protein VFA39_18935 [Steroidobacteraceae bacterium]|nr:hypothetical protein [Steroidobacteraceae bacterium]
MKRFAILAAIVAAIVLGAAAPAIAAGTSAKLSWTAPVAYTDGAALAASDLDHYTITWAPAAGQAGPSGSVTVAGNLLATTVPVPCGSTSFSITLTTTAAAHYPNATSGPAGPVPYVTGVTCSPNAPGAFQAQ